jgi:hypothetical protein
MKLEMNVTEMMICLQAVHNNRSALMCKNEPWTHLDYEINYQYERQIAEYKSALAQKGIKVA